MAFSPLTPSNIRRRWLSAKIYTENLQVPFPEFQRIARNRPRDDIDKAFPRTTDGTAASIVQKTPKRIVQQLPSGKIHTDDEGWLQIVAQFILDNKILPYANEDYSLFEKCHLVIENGLTLGSVCTYTPFLNHDGYYCPDLSIPYWGDVVIPRGKKSGYSLPYVFIRSWWQKDDIDALIDAETKRQNPKGKKSKKQSTESTWDVEALKKVKDYYTAKDAWALTPNELERNVETTGIELVTGFQKGVNAKFYTFNPDSDIVVRTKVNKDPRGEMPVDWFYGDVDGTNPLGRGVIELIGGLQNLIDSDMQAYQWNRAYSINPTIIKKGNIGDVSLVPGGVIDADTDLQASVEALTIDTSAITNYPELYALQKSQLLNLVQSPDTSISSQVGNPGFSKTDAGVKQQNNLISVDDNAIEKRFEAWYRRWAETAINLYFAERSGIEKLQLDKATAMKLRELPNFDQSLLNENNEILIDYDTDTPILKFRVDPGTSQSTDSLTQVTNSTNLLELVMKFPILNKMFGGPIDVDVIARRIVVNLNIEDPEQVAPEPTPEEIESKKLQSHQINPFSPFFDKPSVSIAWEQLPPVAQLDLLRNAGSTNVTLQDILGGPIANINARGNTALNKPLDDPSQLMPGGQSSPNQLNPIDLGDIYKQTTDPAVKAQIEQMAGLQPDMQGVQNQIQTSATEHHAKQAENLTKASVNDPTGAIAHSKVDAELKAQLKRLGLSDGAIAQALNSLNNGASPQQILQSIGAK